MPSTVLGNEPAYVYMDRPPRSCNRLWTSQHISYYIVQLMEQQARRLLIKIYSPSYSRKGENSFVSKHILNSFLFSESVGEADSSSHEDLAVCRSLSRRSVCAESGDSSHQHDHSCCLQPWPHLVLCGGLPLRTQAPGTWRVHPSCADVSAGELFRGSCRVFATTGMGLRFSGIKLNQSLFKHNTTCRRNHHKIYINNTILNNNIYLLV